MSEGIIFVGAGLASYLAIQAIRMHDATIPIQVITSDEGCFYFKPQISNAFSLHKTAEDLKQDSAAALEDKYQIKIIPRTSVFRVDASQHRVETATGTFPYQSCILACGALPRLLPCTGRGVASVLTVNHLVDYERLRRVLQDKKTVIIIGAGLVGVELAEDLSRAGYLVTVLHEAATPMQKILPPAVGRTLAAAIPVTWAWDAIPTHIEEDGDGLVVHLEDGRVFAADCVIAAIGLSPNIALAEASQIGCRHGVLTDQFLQTSATDVYALGDCAEVCGLVYHYVFPIRHAVQALVQTLRGVPTKVQYPAMPVTLKTPSCPVVLCPPPLGQEGIWAFEGEGQATVGVCHNSEGHPIGFVLCGRSVMAKRPTLLSQMPNWLG